MKTVSQFISEALITFGKSAYPKFGNIVILAGGGSFIKTANYIQVKKQGHPQLSSAELSAAITAKIKAYVPLW